MNTLMLHRLKRGMSMRHLARETGLDVATISRVESGADCRMTTAMRIAVALDLSLDELYPLPVLMLAASVVGDPGVGGSNTGEGLEFRCTDSTPALADVLDATDDPGVLATAAIDPHNDNEGRP